MESGTLPGPREAATSDEDSQAGDRPPSEYDSEGTDTEAPVGQGARDGRGQGEANGEGGDEEGIAEEGEGATAGDGVRGRGKGAGRRAPAREPFEVPRTGAFYWHDDRFDDVQPPEAQQRMGEPGKRRGIDGAKWHHDKFQDLEKQFEEGKPVIRGQRRGGWRRGESRPRRTYSGGRHSEKNADNENSPQNDGCRNGSEEIAQRLDGISLQEDEVQLKSHRGRGGRRRGGRGYSRRSQE